MFGPRSIFPSVNQSSTEHEFGSVFVAEMIWDQASFNAEGKFVVRPLFLLPKEFAAWSNALRFESLSEVHGCTISAAVENPTMETLTRRSWTFAVFFNPASSALIAVTRAAEGSELCKLPEVSTRNKTFIDLDEATQA